MQTADWRLPPGVSRGTWESLHREDWAKEEDRWLAQTPLIKLDQVFVEEIFSRAPPQGRIADLGCGAGRVSLALARRGHAVLAVDLSQAMLDQVRAAAEAEHLPIECLRSNLVELDAIESGSCGAAVCLFSTLGMIRGAAHRRKAVQEFSRILAPGGKLLLHAHQFWWNMRQYKGVGWMTRHLFEALVLRKTELGDRYAVYRNVPNFYLHSFRRGELRRLLRDAGFRIRAWRALRGDGGDYLRAPHIFPAFRAGGWLIACEKAK